MMKLKILNKKEVRRILEILNKQWGIKKETNMAFLINRKNRLYVVNKEVLKFDMEKLRVDALGLYLGELTNNEIRLSIEGSQIFGKEATKNVVELDEKQKILWMKGYSIPLEQDTQSFQIVKSGNDFLGCGKIRNNNLTNFVPKTRIIK
ncbi:hypothetical protein D6745_01535 [Candidatus Woesearchaeota archaeon]|nr:MAG: hypothetical protein D6745_01535 [Candidatus Woesearchaeota archaeon]